MRSLWRQMTFWSVVLLISDEIASQKSDPSDLLACPCARMKVSFWTESCPVQPRPVPKCEGENPRQRACRWWLRPQDGTGHVCVPCPFVPAEVPPPLKRLCQPDILKESSRHLMGHDHAGSVRLSFSKLSKRSNATLVSQ